MPYPYVMMKGIIFLDLIGSELSLAYSRLQPLAFELSFRNDDDIVDNRFWIRPLIDFLGLSQLTKLAITKYSRTDEDSDIVIQLGDALQLE